MADGYMMPTGGRAPGRGFSRFVEGLKRGQLDARQAEMDELQMQGMREDREYLRGQRSREARVQAMQDEYAQFSNDLNKALGAYMQSQGANYKPLVDLYNSRYPSESKLSVTRNEDGTFNVGPVSADGKPLGKPGKASFDEFGMLAYTMRNPDLYFQNKLKKEDQKGRFAESERGVLDTATGGFRPHGKGVGGGKPSEIDKHLRLLTNDAVAVLQSHFGGRFEGGMWFPDEENRDVAMNAIEMAADLVKEGESPQRAANIASTKAKAGALPKSRRTSAPAPGAAGRPPADAEAYYKVLREHPSNKGVSDEELRAYVNQKFQAQ